MKRDNGRGAWACKVYDLAYFDSHHPWLTSPTTTQGKWHQQNQNQKESNRDFTPVVYFSLLSFTFALVWDFSFRLWVKAWRLSAPGYARGSSVNCTVTPSGSK
jgi:hypothetical protein